MYCTVKCRSEGQKRGVREERNANGTNRPQHINHFLPAGAARPWADVHAPGLDGSRFSSRIAFCSARSRPRGVSKAQVIKAESRSAKACYGGCSVLRQHIGFEWICLMSSKQGRLRARTVCPIRNAWKGKLVWSGSHRCARCQLPIEEQQQSTWLCCRLWPGWLDRGNACFLR